HKLSGITVPDVMLRVIVAKRSSIDAARRPMVRRGRTKLPLGVLIERRGSLLFTHFGMSGPAVLDVSRAVTGAERPRDVLLLLDFLPKIPADALTTRLRDESRLD